MRRAFTLAELLVTITIILILSGISLRVLVVAQEYARADKTRATIAKINSELMQLYEDKRLQILPANVANLDGSAVERTQSLANRRLLDARRDYLRIQIPDRWLDVLTDPLPFDTVPYTDWWPNTGRTSWTAVLPAVTKRYRQRLAIARNRLIAKGSTLAQANAILNENQSAECLYLVITQYNYEAREYFLDNEVGDVDNDEMNEFVDAWGRPIAFIRWAPAFNDSDSQPNVWDSDTGAYNDNSGRFVNCTHSPKKPTVKYAIEAQHDPTDAKEVDSHAWVLFPLVYSAGPDGDYGIYAPTTAYNGNPFATPDRLPRVQSPPPVTLLDTGRPIGTAHLDNIHNHRAATQ